MTTYATMRVQFRLSDLQLGHLLWDAAMEQCGDADAARLMLTQVGDARKAAMIRGRLAAHGTASVECGPQHPYPDGMAERMCARLARRAFRMEE